MPTFFSLSSPSKTSGRARTLAKWRFGAASSKRMIIIPCFCITALLFAFHLYYIATYPAQLIPPAEYYPTLRSSLSVFPKSMHVSLAAALTGPIAPTKSLAPTSSPPTSPGFVAANTSLIPNRVFQTDVRPPSIRDSHTWDANGFERLFLNDADALAWVLETFGDSEIARVYRALPKPVMYVIITIFASPPADGMLLRHVWDTYVYHSRKFISVST